MGEIHGPVTTCFNRSLRVEHRFDRLTGDPGAVVRREILERSGIVDWMVPQLSDPRRQKDVVHDLASLIRTSDLLAAQGWRDHDDANALREALLQKGGLRCEGPFPLQVQATRTISAVPRALKRVMNEQANAMCSREPANDADVDFSGVAVGVSRGDALSEGLEAPLLGLGAAAGVVSCPSFPERPAVVARGAAGPAGQGCRLPGRG